MSVLLERSLHQITNRLVSALIEHEHGRSGAAQRAAEQTGSAESKDISEAGDEFCPVRLVHAVFERSGEGIVGSGRERGDQQRRSLDIEYRILTRVTIGQGT